MSFEEVKAARKAGFSEGAIVEIVGHAGLNVFANYFRAAYQTKIDFRLFCEDNAQ